MMLAKSKSGQNRVAKISQSHSKTKKNNLGKMDEVRRYAQYINLDVQAFPELVWIAEEGFNCPVPDGWSVVEANGGGHYFLHTSGKRQADHPMDQHYRVLAQRETTRLLQFRARSALDKLSCVEEHVVPRAPRRLVRPTFRRTRLWVYLLIGALLLHLAVSSNVFRALSSSSTSVVTTTSTHHVVHVLHASQQRVVDDKPVAKGECTPSPSEADRRTHPVTTLASASSPPRVTEKPAADDDEGGWFW